MKNVETCKKFTFQLQLLLKVEEMKRYPFTKLVIERGLTKEEYNGTIWLLEELNGTYKWELENGFLNHSHLLLHFAGMLCHKLPVEESIESLYREGIYPELMEELKIWCPT